MSLRKETYTCSECGTLPTHHQCKGCSMYICPECCDKRGVDDLNDIKCIKCSDGNNESTSKIYTSK